MPGVRNDKDLPDKCPKDYLKWTCVAAGMVFAFIFYLVFVNLVYLRDGSTTDTVLATTNGTAVLKTASDVVLTEHINEEDDYDKPVCKRLEESGERYDEE